MGLVSHFVSGELQIEAKMNMMGICFFYSCREGWIVFQQQQAPELAREASELYMRVNRPGMAKITWSRQVDEVKVFEFFGGDLPVVHSYRQAGEQTVRVTGHTRIQPNDS